MKKIILYNLMVLLFWVIILTGIVSPSLCNGQVTQWQRLSGLEGVICTSIAANDSITLATGYEGLYRSNDQGASWQQIPFASAPQRGFVTLSKNGTFFFFADTAYRSTDNGKTWQSIPSLPRRILSNQYFYPQSGAFIAFRTFAELNNSLFVAHYNNTLYQSINDGVTWKPLPPAPSPLSQFTSLGTIVFAIKGYAIGNTLPDDGIFQSDDNGTTWKVTNQRFMGKNVSSLLSAHGKLYASVVDSVYMSSDTGKTWRGINSGLPREDLRAMFQVHKGTLFLSRRYSYLDTSSRLFRFIEQESRWVNVPVPTPPFTTMIFSGVVGPLFVQGFNTLFRSLDTGRTWQPSKVGMEALAFEALASSRWGIFAGSSDGNKTFLSKDKGRTWIETRYPGTGLAPGLVRMAFSEDVGVGTNRIISIGTQDSGRQWREIPEPVPPERPSLQPIFNGSEEFATFKNTVFCSRPVDQGFLIFSHDGGATWSTEPSDALRALGVRGTYYIVTGAKDIVYTFANSGTFLSRDEGRTWEQRSPNIFNRPTQIWYSAWAVNDSTVLASSSTLTRSSENIISRDSGRTWRPLLLPSVDSTLELRQVLHSNQRWVLLAWKLPSQSSAQSSVIYSSTDQGQTWQTESTNLPNGAILDIALDGNTLFVSIRGLGLYRTDLTTVSAREEPQNTIFISFPSPNPSTDYTDLAFTLPRAAEAGVTLYSTLGTEVWRSESATMSAGEQHIRIDTRHLPTGVYVYRLVVDGVSSLGRIVVVR